MHLCVCPVQAVHGVVLFVAVAGYAGMRGTAELCAVFVSCCSALLWAY